MRIKFLIQQYSLIILFTFQASSQKIIVGYGPSRQHTKQTLKLLNGKDDFSYHYNQKIIGLEILLKQKKAAFIISIANYEFQTLMRINKYAGQGFHGAAITRTDFGLSYCIVNFKNRIYIKPSLCIGLQYAKRTADIWAEQVHVYGPDYYQTKLPYSEGHNNFQFVPVAGFSTGVKFLKRCEAGIIIQGIYGYKTFQTLYFYYNHKDSPTVERTAIFESRGTGINSAIFLGINLSKMGNQK